MTFMVGFVSNYGYDQVNRQKKNEVSIILSNHKSFSLTHIFYLVFNTKLKIG